MGATVQTDPGLIEFSSGLLHVYISRMVIIVWYRLDQFAFNPDFRTKEDCVASSQDETTQKRGQEAVLSAPLLHLHLHETNTSAGFISASSSTTVFTFEFSCQTSRTKTT